MLNNRDLAALIWLGLFAGWALSHALVRKQALKALGSLWQRTIRSTLALMTFYICLTVIALQRVGFWDSTQLKDTVVWTLGFGFLTLFQVQSISRDVAKLKGLIWEYVSVVFVLEFFVNAFVMSFLVELLLTPALAIVVLSPLAAERAGEDEAIVSVFKNLQTSAGFGLILFAAYSTYINFTEVATLKTVRDLLLPVALSVLYMPFLYWCALYMAYESLFLRMKFLVRDETVRQYAKKRTICTCHLNLKKLAAWSQILPSLGLKNTEQVDEALRELGREGRTR